MEPIAMFGKTKYYSLYSGVRYNDVIICNYISSCVRYLNN